MFSNLTGWHFLIVLVIILLLFGAPKLPALAKSLGQSMRILKGEMRTAKDESGETDHVAAPHPDLAKGDATGTATAARTTDTPAADGPGGEPTTRS